MNRLWLAGAMAAGAAWAHQPIMDMAPRWAGGWGFQHFSEFRIANDLLNGTEKRDNPFGVRQRVNTHWLEGVYTFRREMRLTIKIPWRDQERTVLKNGTAVHQRGDGWGDIILGAPFKKYVNKRNLTYNYGITPMLGMPTGSTSDAFPVGDGSWDPGISLSASFESPTWYHLYDLWYWKNTQSSRGWRGGDQAGLDINIGRSFPHPEKYQGAFIMWDISARWQDTGRDFSHDTGGESIAMGPALVFFKGNWMLRLEYRMPIYERRNGRQPGDEKRFAIGLGITF